MKVKRQKLCHTTGVSVRGRCRAKLLTEGDEDEWHVDKKARVLTRPDWLAHPHPAATGGMQAGQVPSGLPNLYYGAIPHDQLRQDPAYISLAPTNTVTISGLHSCRYIRQDDDLWGLLHPGVLTTGRLPAALGFLEPRAGKVVGCAKQSSHGALQSAYKHLRQPVAGVLQESAKQHAASPSAATSCGVPITSRHSASSTAVWQHNFPAAPGIGNNVQHAPMAAVQTSSTEAQARRQRCQAAAAGGPIGVAQHWGVVQEAASLHALLQLFDKSVVEEAGLHMLQLEDLPASWGFAAGSLPLIGASPDATVCHLIPLDTPAALRLALQLQCALQTVSSQQPSEQQQEHGSQARMGSPSSSARMGEDGAVLDLLRAALALVALRHSCTANAAMSDGEASNDELEDNSARADSSDVTDEGECNEDTGACDLPSNGTSQHDQPQQHQHNGATCDDASALAQSMHILHINGDPVTTSSCSSSAAANGPGSECTTSLQPSINYCSSQQVPSSSMSARCGRCQQEHCCQLVAMPPVWQVVDSVSSSQLYGALTWQAPLQGAVSVRCLQGRCWLMLREAVEVKNSCPFQVRALAGRRSKQGKWPRVAWVFSDRGPRAPSPHWMPQLQLHMLATGCWSVLVACRSASRGLCLYRIYRDSTYLQLMLTFVCQLHEKHVLKGVPPPKDAFFMESQYRHLLSSTAAMARRAELIASTEGQETEHHQDADLRQFLAAA